MHPLYNSVVSGTGSFACQLAKNVFGAGKVITTVSTSKVPKVPALLGEGVVDQGMCTDFPDKPCLQSLLISSHQSHHMLPCIMSSDQSIKLWSANAKPSH